MSEATNAGAGTRGVVPGEISTLRRLWDILTSGHRRRTGGFLVLLVVGMVLETLGIGLVVPVLTLMTEDGAPSLPAGLPPMLSGLRQLDQTQLVLYGMGVLVAIYLVKTAYLIFLNWRQFVLLADVQVDLSQRLFAGYLRQPYAFHLQRNSAELLRNVVTEVSMVNAGLTSALTLIAEGLVIVGVTVLLLALEPIGASIAFVMLGLAGVVFHQLTRRAIRSWGESRQHHEGLRYQHLLQALGGIKDVILLGRAENFVATHQFHNASRAAAERRQMTLQAMPRLLLELLVILTLAAIVVLSMGRGEDTPSLVPALGLFAAAAFRLMPSANRMLGSLQSLRYVAPGIETALTELRALPVERRVERAPHVPLQFSRDIVLDKLTFAYEGAAQPSLTAVSQRIERGMAVGIIGASGAGKSTLVDVVLGLLAPASGTVRVDGADIQTNLRGWQDQIGYVPQSIFLTDDTLRRNIAFGVAEGDIDDQAVAHAIEAAQLGEFVRELPAGVQTMVGERGVRLSGGQRQRIGIARALYHNPPVLVLDEATSALDAATEREVMATVRTLHGAKTLIIIAHRLSTVEYCDRILRLERGRLIEEGAASDVLKKVASSAP